MNATGISPAAAASAYARVEAGQATTSQSFGDALGNALQSAIDAGHQADAQAAAGINGTGDLTQVVTAVNQAELALQTTTAIRDRVVQAYQDIMRMPI
jgi:flagellar hook-basal body complex protein FliE